MTQENDMPDGDRPRQVDAAATAGDDAARRYTSDQAERVAENTHEQPPHQDEAIAKSAEILRGWDRADPLTREKQLNAVGREMMTVHEAPPPDLLTQPMEPGYRGSYVDEDFAMRMNQDLPKGELTDALHTYLHEYRHSEQAYEIQKAHTPMWSPENAPRVSALESNQKQYADPEVDYDKYSQQLLERDANHFADTNTDAIIERLKGNTIGPSTDKT